MTSGAELVVAQQAVLAKASIVVSFLSGGWMGKGWTWVCVMHAPSPRLLQHGFAFLAGVLTTSQAPLASQRRRAAISLHILSVRGVFEASVAARDSSHGIFPPSSCGFFPFASTWQLCMQEK